jgi:hypothetical protein
MILKENLYNEIIKTNKKYEKDTRYVKRNKLYNKVIKRNKNKNKKNTRKNIIYHFFSFLHKRREQRVSNESSCISTY